MPRVGKTLSPVGAKAQGPLSSRRAEAAAVIVTSDSEWSPHLLLTATSCRMSFTRTAMRSSAYSAASSRLSGVRAGRDVTAIGTRQTAFNANQLLATLRAQK